MAANDIGAIHRRRLRDLWRSAGWPFQDLVEVELLAAGLILRVQDAAGRETLRVTDAGVAELARTLQKNRAARDAHEALVGRVAREMQRAGRVVWRGLSLRAWVGQDKPRAWVGQDKPPDSDDASAPAPWLTEPQPLAADTERCWAIAMPDVYSIRHTTVEAYVEPVVHEIKVRRGDLLSDLRRPAKAQAYRWLASQCWYVLAAGIGRTEEIPEVYGVMFAAPDGSFEVTRPAPRRAMTLPFAVWMALARATPEAHDDHPQAPLV